MNTTAPSATTSTEPELSTLSSIPIADFVARWRGLTGEPPAVMLTDRTEMLMLLVNSVPAAPLKPAAQIDPSDLTQRNACPEALSYTALPTNVLKFRSPSGRSPAP